jgi:hypothetical protein
MPYAPSKMGMDWPSFSLIIAFFQDERLPAYRPSRLIFPSIFWVRTASTLTLKMD